MFVVYRLADANYSCRNEMPEFGCIDADDMQATSDSIKKKETTPAHIRAYWNKPRSGGHARAFGIFGDWSGGHFLADRPSRAKKILSFIENTVYLSASAGEVAIRAGLKAGRQAEEILSYPPFTEWTVAIDNQLAAEALIAQVKTPDADVTEVGDDEVLHMPVGDPEVDMTLVPLRSRNWSYATLRHHLLAESDVEFWRRCRSVTSLVQSGNMIEVAFGYQICIVGTILNSVCHVQVDGP